MRTRHLATACALFALLALVSADAPSAQVGSPPPYRVSDVRAHLFYSDRGDLSPNIIGRTDLALWNTIIGEGDAGGASSATLIVVEVAGAPGSFSASRKVELAVRASGKETFRRAEALSVLNEKGRGYVAFWLPGTGCEPLRLSTALIGQPNPSRRTAEIPFRCGE